MKEDEVEEGMGEGFLYHAKAAAGPCTPCPKRRTPNPGGANTTPTIINIKL